MKKFNMLCFVGLISACILFFDFSPETIWSADKTELEGKWVSATPDRDMRFTFSGENFSIKSPNVPNYWYKGTFKIDKTVDPDKIDLNIKEGGIPQYVSKSSFGIYKIEEGMLIMALNQPGVPDYPPSFEKPGNAIVFKLKKKEKN